MGELREREASIGGATRRGRYRTVRPPETPDAARGSRSRSARMKVHVRGESVSVGEGLAPGSESGRRGTFHEAALRLLNVTVATVTLLLLSPLILLIAVAIKLDSGNPILYRQVRVGIDRRRGREADGSAEEGRRTGDLGGCPFVLYKFRTMAVNAERDTGPSWAGREDDRATRVGRFLRRHRLDEIPQLWNVVKGDMAVVGPRPERPLFFQRLRQTFDAYPTRQTVPPGITGWAQVNRDTDMSLDDVEHKLRYDLEYLRRRSVWFDAYIMLKTPIVMLRREAVTGEGSSQSDRATLRKEAT